jgi:putative CocE/NonD family hydrolase
MLLPVRPKQTLSMQTRDGVRLDADVYYPDSAGEFPVLLMRQPYGRAIASTVVYAHPIWYAAHGYIVVIQDVRGRGSSAGEFDLFAHEIDDGFDAVSWAAALPQSSGQVGMYGFSYQGMTQLYAAAAHPPALKTLCPSMVAYDLYDDWAYEGGAFCYQLNLAWAIQLAAETARRKGNSDAYRTLYAAARTPLIHDPVCVRSGILKQLAPDSHYHDWINHPEPDEYWDRLSPKTYLHHVDLPMLHIGGWFDTYLRGTLRLYREMASRSTAQHLLVGPWAHLPWGRSVGGVDYGAEAASPVDRLQIRWFDQVLKGVDTGLLNESPICLFEMGSNQWRKFDALLTENSIPYFLGTTGLANLGDREGTLVERQTLAAAQHDVFVHDPWRPVPSQGGHAAFPAGSVDRTSLDCRTDVVTYTSASLGQALHLVGEVTVDLYCTADAPSFDLCAVLSEVKPSGSVHNITQGYRRIHWKPEEEADRADVWQPTTEIPIQSASSEPISIAPDAAELDPLDTQPSPGKASPADSPQMISITLQPTCICIAKGNAIRLSISAACFPAYAVNPGVGTPPVSSRLIDARVITLVIYSGGEHLSQIRLPCGSP